MLRGCGRGRCCGTGAGASRWVPQPGQYLWKGRSARLHRVQCAARGEGDEGGDVREEVEVVVLVLVVEVEDEVEEMGLSLRGATTGGGGGAGAGSRGRGDWRREEGREMVALISKGEVERLGEDREESRLRVL